MGVEAALYLAAGLMIFGSAIGGAIGIGMVGSKLIESLGRQPDLLPFFRTQAFIFIGLIDAIPMIGIGIALFILFALGPGKTM